MRPGTLNDRLRLIAQEIEKGETVADIGTDHGFLPIYLAENGISKKVIMTDISGASLQKAVDDLDDSEASGEAIEARKGDGLDPLGPGECDTVVIAGMGGLLIRDIMDWDLSRTRSFGRFILQPRNRAGDLRKWLDREGFDRYREMLVKEGSHYCEIICVKTCDRAGKGSFPEKSMAEYDFPDGQEAPFGDGLLDEYYSFELKKARDVLGKVRSAPSPDGERISSIEARIERLEALWKRRNS